MVATLSHLSATSAGFPVQKGSNHAGKFFHLHWS